MIQKTLAFNNAEFVTDAECATEVPIARSTDPQTSHDAARKAEATRTATINRCCEILRRANTPMTADEIAFHAVDTFFPGLPKSGREYINTLGNHRKRAHELHNIYGLAEIVEGQRRNGSRLIKLKEQP